MRKGSLPRPLYSFILGREKAVWAVRLICGVAMYIACFMCVHQANHVMATILHEAIKHGYFEGNACMYMPYTGRILIQLIYTQIIVIQCARV